MLAKSRSFSPRRALAAITRLLRDPDDLPQVFTVIQALSGRAPERMVERMRVSPSGARLLARRADIVPLLSDRDALARLPDGSLGRAYLAFLTSENISAAGIIDASARGFTPGQPIDPEVAWLHQRMRDTHDLWHALIGYRGDLLGETALLAFSLAQTRNPGIGLMVGAGYWKAGRSSEARRVIRDGFRRGRRAEWLPAVEWESLLSLPIDEVRRRLGAGIPPRYTPIRSRDLRAAA